MSQEVQQTLLRNNLEHWDAVNEAIRNGNSHYTTDKVGTQHIPEIQQKRNEEKAREK